jgi:hypothetical protein
VRRELRSNLVANLVREWASGAVRSAEISWDDDAAAAAQVVRAARGRIWESYDPETGFGRGVQPFTGWSALVVRILTQSSS